MQWGIRDFQPLNANNIFEGASARGKGLGFLFFERF